jgi:hypothetical protein
MLSKTLVMIITLLVVLLFANFVTIIVSRSLLQALKRSTYSIQHDISNESQDSATQQSKKNSIFCIILTTPERLKTRGLTVLYVWVSKCSNYRFVTMTPSYLSHPDNSSTLKKSPFNLLHPRGLLRDNYWELTNKVYYAFRDIYEEFGDQYDWYLKADG